MITSVLLTPENLKRYKMLSSSLYAHEIIDLCCAYSELYGLPGKATKDGKIKVSMHVKKRTPNLSLVLNTYLVTLEYQVMEIEKYVKRLDEAKTMLDEATKAIKVEYLFLRFGLAGASRKVR